MRCEGSSNFISEILCVLSATIFMFVTIVLYIRDFNWSLKQDCIIQSLQRTIKLSICHF